MATLKHISSKNSDYTAIEAYLVYQHDAFTGKQLLDEQGKPKLRDSYLLDTLECSESSFAMACLIANRKYGNPMAMAVRNWFSQLAITLMQVAFNRLHWFILTMTL